MEEFYLISSSMRGASVNTFNDSPIKQALIYYTAVLIIKLKDHYARKMQCKKNT